MSTCGSCVVTAIQNFHSCVREGPFGPGPARAPRGRREHGARPLRLGSRPSFAAEAAMCRWLPHRACAWWETQPRPGSGIPQAGPRREDLRGRYYLEAGQVRRPYPSRFKDRAQIMVVKRGGGERQLKRPDAQRSGPGSERRAHGRRHRVRRRAGRRRHRPAGPRHRSQVDGVAATQGPPLARGFLAWHLLSPPPCVAPEFVLTVASAVRLSSAWPLSVLCRLWPIEIECQHWRRRK
jgi:hypothetical protein